MNYNNFTLTEFNEITEDIRDFLVLRENKECNIDPLTTPDNILLESFFFSDNKQEDIDDNNKTALMEHARLNDIYDKGMKFDTLLESFNISKNEEVKRFLYKVKGKKLNANNTIPVRRILLLTENNLPLWGVDNCLEHKMELYSKLLEEL